MSTTTVILNEDSMGLCVPSVNSVPIEAGTQVTFKTAQGVSAALYFPCNRRDSLAHPRRLSCHSSRSERHLHGFLGGNGCLWRVYSTPAVSGSRLFRLWRTKNSPCTGHLARHGWYWVQRCLKSSFDQAITRHRPERNGSRAFRTDACLRSSLKENDTEAGWEQHLSFALRPGLAVQTALPATLSILLLRFFPHLPCGTGESLLNY